MLFQTYKRWMAKHPRRTNSITTGALFGLGDAMAQLALHDKTGDSGTRYDGKRTARAVIYGSAIFSPLGSRWLRWLNQLHITQHKASNLVSRVAIDQLVFAPLGIPFYFGCMTLMEGNHYRTAVEKIRMQWKRTLLTNWMVWPAVQLLNFAIVPLQYRLLTINVVALFWNAFLSFQNSNVPDPAQKAPVYYPPMVE